MSVPAVQQHQVRCHHCQNWVGESPVPVEFVGLFRDPPDRNLVVPPRLTYQCRSCRWVTVFRPVGEIRKPWRQDVELKQRTG